MSVSMRSPEGPVTRHFNPLSSTAIAGAYLLRALSGWARSVSLKLLHALAIEGSVTALLLVLSALLALVGHEPGAKLSDQLGRQIKESIIILVGLALGARYTGSD
jgi:hypothetical protein